MDNDLYMFYTVTLVKIRPKKAVPVFYFCILFHIVWPGNKICNYHSTSMIEPYNLSFESNTNINLETTKHHILKVKLPHD